MTQYAGMNAFCFVAVGHCVCDQPHRPNPDGGSGAVVVLVHLSSYLVTFIASLYQTINETKRIPFTFASAESAFTSVADDDVGFYLLFLKMHQEERIRSKTTTPGPPLRGGPQFVFYIIQQIGKGVRNRTLDRQSYDFSVLIGKVDRRFVAAQFHHHLAADAARREERRCVAGDGDGCDVVFAVAS